MVLPVARKRFSIPLQLGIILIFALITIIINYILFTSGSKIGIIDANVTKELNGIQQSITSAAVIKATFFGYLFGSFILFFLSFFTNKFVGNFLVIAVIIISFLLPFVVFENIPITMGIWLNLMHVTIGISLLLLFNYVFINRKKLTAG